MISQEDKYIGVFVGGCIGDIMGKQTEGLTRHQIRQQFKNGIVTELPKCKRYTDDTEMTINLGNYLLKYNIIDIDGLHKYYSDNLTIPNRGYSNATFNILKKFTLSDKPPKGHSRANGGLMRIAPMSLMQYDNDRMLCIEIEKALWYTHAERSSVLICYLHCKLLTYLLKSKEKNITVLFDKIIELSKIDNDIYCKLKICKFSLITDSKCITEELTGDINTFQIKAIDALCCAYFTFFKWHNNPLKAVSYASSMGGDTDTIAKLVGELCGAYHGYKWIPEKWLSDIENIEIIWGIGKQFYLNKNKVITTY